MKNSNQKILFVTTASAALTLAATLSTDVMESDHKNNIESRADATIDEDDDGHFYIPHEGDSTLSATFSIQITPEHYHMLSWTILWLCFVSAVAFGMHQIRLERRWIRHAIATSNSSSGSSRSGSLLASRKQTVGSPSDPEMGGGSGGNRSGKNYTRGSGRLVLSSGRLSGSRDRMTQSTSMASINSNSNTGNMGDENAISSGDLARAKFRRVLLFAIISRTFAMPIQIYSDPLWLQLIADTFPVMAFATAWTWIVSFFVKLVGVALGANTDTNLRNYIGGANIGRGGGGNNPSPTLASNTKPIATIDAVILITAYVVYALLIITFTIFRRIAAVVLLYALLCCVYATLLGMGMYFFPRLLGLLAPRFGGNWQSPLALKLTTCSFVFLLVFLGHTLSLAKKVVQSTVPSSHKGDGPYWWFQYGALELLPGLLLLALLHPKSILRPTAAREPGLNDPEKSATPSGDPYPAGRKTPPLHAYHKRTDSSDSKSGEVSRLTPSPGPSRSPPPPPLGRQAQQQQIQQQLGGSISSIVSNPSVSHKETTPLLSSHSSLRYTGSGPATADPNKSLEAVSNIQQQVQQPGNDRSTHSS